METSTYNGVRNLELRLVEMGQLRVETRSCWAIKLMLELEA